MSPVALLSFMWILVKEIKESLISLLLYFYSCGVRVWY